MSDKSNSPTVGLVPTKGVRNEDLTSGIRDLLYDLDLEDILLQTPPMSEVEILSNICLKQQETIAALGNDLSYVYSMLGL